MYPFAFPETKGIFRKLTFPLILYPPFRGDGFPLPCLGHLRFFCIYIVEALWKDRSFGRI